MPVGLVSHCGAGVSWSGRLHRQGAVQLRWNPYFELTVVALVGQRLGGRLAAGTHVGNRVGDRLPNAGQRLLWSGGQPR